MRGPGPFLMLWASLLALIMLVGVVVFGPHGPYTPALLGGAALAAFLTGAGLATRGRGAPRRAVHGAPDISPPTVWLAFAIALACVGAALGYWLCLIAAGMAGVGAGALFREVRSERRAVRSLR